MQRQAVDQVDADRLEFGRSRRLHQFAGLLLGLDAIDSDLHLLVEILHAETQAVEAQLAQFVNLLGRDGAGVDFQRKLVAVAVVHVERLAQRIHQIDQLLTGQIGRRTAAQMQLGQLARVIEQGRLHLDFTLEVLEVLDGTLGLVGDDLVAGAVVAKALAERNVDVHRQRLGGRGLVGFPCGAAIVIDGEGLMELRCGGVGGIARTWTVVFLDQGAVKARRLVHVRGSPWRLKGGSAMLHPGSARFSMRCDRRIIDDSSPGAGCFRSRTLRFARMSRPARWKCPSGRPTC